MSEIQSLGFNKFDIRLLIEKGVASLDKQLVVEQLAELNKDVKARMARDTERKKKLKAERKRIKETKQKVVNKRGDIRDSFKHNDDIPFLAPEDFKPL